MLNFKEGQTYICTKSNESWWTEGKEYTVTLDRYGTPLLPDNDGYKWSSHSLNESSHQFELKEDTKLTLKEGQTYVCLKSDRQYRIWWTVGKEYKVVLDDSNKPGLLDDENDHWDLTELTTHNLQFKLKEEQPEVTMEDLKADTDKQKYSAFDVTKVILRAYNMYDNDAQRLAFIKGYFAK